MGTLKLLCLLFGMLAADVETTVIKEGDVEDDRIVDDATATFETFVSAESSSDCCHECAASNKDLTVFVFAEGSFLIRNLLQSEGYAHCACYLPKDGVEVVTRVPNQNDRLWIPHPVSGLCGAMSSSAMGPGRLWIGTTTTELGIIKAGVSHEVSEAASICCGKCLAKFPSTTRINSVGKLSQMYHSTALKENYKEYISCQCLEDAPGKTAVAQPPHVIGTCGNKTLPGVTVGIASQVAWLRAMQLVRVDGVEDSATCCERCNNVVIYPATEFFEYIDTDEARFSMLPRHQQHDGRCVCYSTMGGTPPFTYPSKFYAGVCDA